MTLEKVLTALSICIPVTDEDGKRSCVVCPYWECKDTIELPERLIEDIRALLKAKEPKLLTLSEFKRLPSAEYEKVPVCIEQRVPVGEWDKGSMCKWVGADFAQEMYLEDNVYYNRRTYGKTWRAWDGLPTKAQREDTEWIMI